MSPQEGPGSDRGPDRASDRRVTARHETDEERYDRNWTDLLQEIRVTQMGTQIMTGFLLAAAFQDRMADLDGFQLTVYLVLVCLGVGTTALGLAPVSLHRTLFRQGRKQTTVELGHRILRVVLVGVVLMLVGTTVLIFDLVIGTVPALIAGSMVLATTAGFVLLTHRVEHRSR